MKLIDSLRELLAMAFFIASLFSIGFGSSNEINRYEISEFHGSSVSFSKGGGRDSSSVYTKYWRNQQNFQFQKRNKIFRWKLAFFEAYIPFVFVFSSTFFIASPNRNMSLGQNKNRLRYLVNCLSIMYSQLLIFNFHEFGACIYITKENPFRSHVDQDQN